MPTVIQTSPRAPLRFKPGDLVQVRSPEEILATLDATGSVDGLPFMPEMLPLCGKRLRVLRQASKVCVTDSGTTIRGLHNTVTLGIARCSGACHGDCEAGCSFLWKEAWLMLPGAASSANETHGISDQGNEAAERELHQINLSETYHCQATALHAATQRLPWWALSQYVTDVRDNGVSPRDVATWLRNAIARRCRIFTHNGTARVPTNARSTATDGRRLRAGASVYVKSRAEVAATLDRNGCHRGLWWDPEMYAYCDKRFTVLRPIRQIVDERTGKMLRIGPPTVALDGIYCSGDRRRFCSRNSLFYWREVWLRPGIHDPSSS